MKRLIPLFLALLTLTGCSTGAEQLTPEETIDAFFSSGDYAYRTTQEALDDEGNVVQTIIEGKRTNSTSPKKEYYEYLESPYTLSYTECYAEQNENNVVRVKLHMTTDKWVDTTGSVATVPYHESLTPAGEDTVNSTLCDVYTTSYLWEVPESFGLTEDEAAQLSGTEIKLTYYMDKASGLPVRIVTDSGDVTRWLNIAYTYANRYASMLFDLTLEQAMELYPEQEQYHNVQIFDILDSGDHIEVTDPST